MELCEELFHGFEQHDGDMIFKELCAEGLRNHKDYHVIEWFLGENQK